MKLHYDLHLHSCLSPCGDEEMTPYNLVQMAALLGYGIIALTDHNSTGNCRSAMQVGEEAGIVVVPGMELCTAEEIHVLCLFPGLAEAEAFGAYVGSALPPVKNKPEIFGRQLFMDEQDGITGEEELLLVTASAISIEEVRGLMQEYRGYCYPAHIDRSSFSVLSSLGVFPPELGFRHAEVTPNADLSHLREENPGLQGVQILRSSDAHRLEDMPDPERTVELENPSAAALIQYLNSQ